MRKVFVVDLVYFKFNADSVNDIDFLSYGVNLGTFSHIGLIHLF